MINITPKRLETIKEKVKENLDLKEIYKNYIDYFDYKKYKITFKKFENIFIDYILNGYDENNNLKVFDDYNHLEDERFFKLELFKEEITEKTTDILINFDPDHDEFNNFEGLEYDFIMEDLGLRLQNDKPEYKSFSSNDLYIKITCFNGVVSDELQYYNNFKEFFEELDNLVYNYKINDLFMLFLYEYHGNDFCIDPKLDFNKLEKEIKTEIKTELKKREENLLKEKYKYQLKINKINKELEHKHKPIITNSLFSYKVGFICKVEAHKTIIKDIRGYLKK